MTNEPITLIVTTDGGRSIPISETDFTFLFSYAGNSTERFLSLLRFMANAWGSDFGELTQRRIDEQAAKLAASNDQLAAAVATNQPNHPIT